MSDDADRIREQMRRIRQDLGVEVKDIVRGAKELSDWRCYVRKYPWVCVGGAFALGFLAMPGRKRPLDADTQKLVEQLKTCGLTAATRAMPLMPGGLTGKLLSIAGPILVRNVSQLIAQQFKAGGAAPPQASPPGPPHAPESP